VLGDLEDIDVAAGKAATDGGRVPLQVGRQDMHRAEQIDLAFITFLRVALDMPQRGCGDLGGRQRRLDGGLGERRSQQKPQDQQYDVRAYSHSRHRAPAAITSADPMRRAVNCSAKNILPSKTANNTLVSRKAETVPIGALVMAKITMP